MIHTLQVQITNAFDDAEEIISTGVMDLHSGDIDLGWSDSNPQISGLRFTGITVPKGAIITNAYIQFTSEEAGTGAANFTIRGEASADAAQFTGAAKNISSRAQTDASVNWSPSAWASAGLSGAQQRSPDLSTIIQEIIGLDGWEANNSLVLTVMGSGYRAPFAYDRDPNSAAVLVIEYEYVDSPIVSIAATANASEAGALGIFLVSLSEVSDTDTIVSYVVSGTATPGADYQAVSGTVSIAAGQLNAQIAVQAIDDLKVEGNETVTVTLTSVVSGDDKFSVNTTPATVTIVDNDTPTTVSIVASSHGSEPGADGLFTVTLSKAATTDTVISYTVTGTATPGSDYQALSGTVTIAAGQLSAQIHVEVLDDFFAEGDETVVVRLSSIVAGDENVVLNTNPATVTIADNDTPTYVSRTLQVKISHANDDAEEVVSSGLVELDSGDIDLGWSKATPQVSGLRFNGIDIPKGAIITNAYIQFTSEEAGTGASNLVVRGEASANASQFSTAAGDISSRAKTDASVSWSPSNWNAAGLSGANQRTPDLSAIIQEIVGLNGWEANNSIVLTVTGSGHRAPVSFDGDPNGAAVLVVEYSFVDSPTVSIAAASNASENGADGLFVVTLSKVAATDTVVAYTVTGTATAGADYAALSGTIIIPAGQLSVQIPVQVIDDLKVEGNETVTINLSGIVAGDPDVKVDHKPATVTITDNDTPTVATIVVGNDGSEPGMDGAFIVKLSKAATTDTIIAYTVTGSATAGEDYTALSGTVTIPAGQLSVQIPVHVLDDGETEGNETVTVQLSSVTSGDENVVVDSKAATVTIADDDIPFVASVMTFRASSTEVSSTTIVTESNAAEPSTDGMFVVTLSKISATDTTIAYTVTGSATPDSDYHALSGTIVIPAGQLSAQIPVQVIDDFLIEGDETVVVTLNSIVSGDPEISIDQSPATVVIADDDEIQGIKSLSVRISSASDDAEEILKTGVVDLFSGDIDLGYSDANAQISGLRFNGIDIPQGAIITNAYIQFTSEEAGTGASSLTIRGQASANAAQFTGATKDISSRPKTDAVVSWTPSNWNSAGLSGNNQRTPDLSSIIQEIIGVNGWEADNSLVLTVSGTGYRAPFAYDSNPGAAAVLVVEYTTDPWVQVKAVKNAAEHGAVGEFVVSMNKVSTVDTVITYTIAGTATPGSGQGADYQPLSGTVTIAAGELSAKIFVQPFDDLIPESNETVTITLNEIVSGNPNISISDKPATVEIIDNDAPRTLHKFWVMADSSLHYAPLSNYIKNVPSGAEFILHLGDIKKGQPTAVDPNVYPMMAGILKDSKVPVFIVLGDNEYNDTDNPELALELWRENFTHFDQNWSHNYEVNYQDVRAENFSFVSEGVLFIGLTMMGGDYHDPQEWAARSADNLAWLFENFSSYGADVSSAVVLAHAFTGKYPAYGAFEAGFIEIAANFDKPILYLHGDDHEWRMDNPYEDAQNITRVILGPTQATVQPLMVSISNDADNPFSFDHDFVA